MSIYRVKTAEEEYVPKKDVVLKKEVDFDTGKKSDKSKKPFNPADPDEGFDPSSEAYVTVPSEIQALTPDQQKHIMSAKQQKANDPEYVYYVLNKTNNRIRHGWTNKEDAIEGMKDDYPGSCGKIVHITKLKNYGIDPEDDTMWRVDYNPEEGVPKQSKLIGKELKGNLSYLASTKARDDVFYAEDKEEEEPEEE